MLNVHTMLWNDVEDADLSPIRELSGDISVTCHSSVSSFLAQAHSAELVLTWNFESDWYAACPALSRIMTPAAGRDWVSPDPAGRVSISHGTFHGPVLAESLVEALLFMNRRMKTMLANFEERHWDRNLQTGCPLLADQTVLIIGYGNIGQACARLVHAFGARVIGVRRTPAASDSDPGSPARVVGTAQLDEVLPMADHVVLLLPGDETTEGFMSRDRLLGCRENAFVYSFGRGGSLRSADLLAALDHLGGAYLDVTDEEPLPPDSPLWQHEKVMITPHSSCVTRSYRQRFITEVCEHLAQLVPGS
ncbi:MAG: NAD(P)-dependent oxidoreductase [Proteobacteria bacterium]|nr:NAD(P)-dependent oxidoreductase [Pseudomonadota bacterium]